jgi:NodT family efflux transporter outer membrane factor (OMF) lipoprotein
MMLQACGNVQPKANSSIALDRSKQWMQGDIALANQGAGTGSSSISRWWESVDQPELKVWIQTALQNNTDLRASLARLSQARAQAGIAQAARMPVIYGTAISSATNGGSNAMGTLGTANGSIRDQLNIQMSYEFDWWGKREFSIESALYQVQSTEFGVESFQISMVSEVAVNYFKAASLRERMTINQRMLKMAQKNTLDIKRKLELGEATQVMLSQQLIFEQTLLAQNQDLQTQHEQTIHQLAYLVGTHGESLPPIAQKLSAIKWPELASIKTSDLLCRRPDLMQAESDLWASNADVAVARTLLLPSPTVNLTAGQIGTGLTGLLAGPSGFIQSALAASQLIFDGGARRMGVAVSEARRDELIERYASAILAALRDTESALVGVKKSEEKLMWLEENRAEAQRLAHQMQIMLERGGLDFAQLIQIQTTVFSSEDAAVIGSLDRIIAQIDLYKAIGGSVKPLSGDCLKSRGRS